MGFGLFHFTTRKILRRLADVRSPPLWWYIAHTVILLSVLSVFAYSLRKIIVPRGTKIEGAGSAFEIPPAKPVKTSVFPIGTSAADGPVVSLSPLPGYPDSTVDFRYATEYWLRKGEVGPATALFTRWPDSGDNRRDLLAGIGNRVSDYWRALSDRECATYGVPVGGSDGSPDGDEGSIKLPAEIPDEFAYAITANVSLRCQREHPDIPPFILQAFVEYSLTDHPDALVSWSGIPHERIPREKAGEAMQSGFISRQFKGPLLSLSRRFHRGWRDADGPTRDWALGQMGEHAGDVEILLENPVADEVLLERLIEVLPPALTNTWRYEIRVCLFQNNQLAGMMEKYPALDDAISSLEGPGLTKNDVVHIVVTSPLWLRELARLHFDRALGTIPDALSIFGLARAAPSIQEVLSRSLNEERRAFAHESFPWPQVCMTTGIRTPPEIWEGFDRLPRNVVRQLLNNRRELPDLSAGEFVEALRTVAQKAKSDTDRMRIQSLADRVAANRGLRAFFDPVDK